MPFTPRDWKDYPDTTTPITAAALEDLETRVAFRQTHAARARRNTSLSLAASTFAVVPFNATDFDTSGGGATGVVRDASPYSKLYAPVAGVYLVEGLAIYADSGVAAALRHITELRKNGDGTNSGVLDRHEITHPTANTYPTTNPKAIVQLAAGDYVEMWCLTTSAGSLKSSSDAVAAAPDPHLSLALL